MMSNKEVVQFVRKRIASNMKPPEVRQLLHIVFSSALSTLLPHQVVQHNLVRPRSHFSF